MVVWEWVPGQPSITWGKGVERIYGVPADELILNMANMDLRMTGPDIGHDQPRITTVTAYEGEFRVVQRGSAVAQHSI